MNNQKIAISPIMDDILQIFFKKTGIRFDEKKDIVADKIYRFFKSKNFSDESDFKKNLLNNGDLFQEFINLLTVNETYFYRENFIVEHFAQIVKDSHKTVKILCMPCSTGEEPYTISIILHELNVPKYHFHITACDIDTNVIKKAKDGLYSQRSVHKLPQQYIDKYFDQTSGMFEIDYSLRHNIDFMVANLFDDSFLNLGKFDYIFSRNLFIYFDKEIRDKGERIFYSMLKDGGYLFVGHADLLSNCCGFKRDSIRGIPYYQKI